MKSGLPRKRKEDNWAKAKKFALETIRDNGEITSPELVEKLNKEFDFRYVAAPYNVIKTLIDDRKIHFNIISGNTRLLKYGPPSGNIEIIGKPKDVYVEESNDIIDSSEMVEEAQQFGNDPTDVELRVMQNVTKETAKNVLRQIDRELDRAITPSTRAKLRLVAAMSKEAGYEIDDESPIEMRNKLRALFC